MPDEAREPNKNKKKSIGDFLIETGWSPFVFIGKCVNFFGILSVIAFMLGAVCTYLYSRNENLPYYQSF
jgi:hypothetical protein